MKTIAKKNIPGLIFLFALFLAAPQFAQAQHESEFDDMKKKFEQFQDDVGKKFVSYRDSVDQEFSKYIRQAWKEFETYSGAIPPLGPDKPDHQPKVDPRKIDAPREISGEVVNPDQAENLNFTPIGIPENKRDPNSSSLRSIDVEYFGISLPMQYDPAMYFEMEGSYAESIPTSWEYISGTDYYPLILQLSLVAERMNLNDWGYFRLIQQFAQRFYPGEYDQQVLFSCFILNKSGYKAKIGFSYRHMYLLLATVQDVFEVPYLTIKKDRYYVFTLNPEVSTKNLSVTTYEGDYQESDRAINFAFRNQMNLPRNIKFRDLSFTHQDTLHAFQVAYNQSLVDFYRDMPLVGFEVTLSAPLSNEAMASIHSGLAPLLRGKSEQERIDLLLAFSQKSFEYKTDQEQFGAEKYLYPEEVLFYPSSDCEDRAALFSVLTRELAGLEVMGLVFPRHVATAVKFNESVEGDFITYEEEKYVVCDPTYIGASTGMCMEKFKETEVQLVLLK